MRRSNLATFAPCVLALASLLLAGPVGAEPPAPSPAATFLEKAADSIVTLKYVLKHAQGEREAEARGAVVDPSGLVVLSNNRFSGGGVQVVNLRVTLGTDPKEWDAVIVARDSVIGLAYVQVLDLGDKKLPAVDLAKGGEVKIGQDLQGVTRDARAFDFAPWLTRHYVSSRVEKPRPMWAFSGDSFPAGMPLYDAQGRPVGVTAYQRGSEGDEDATGRTFLLPLDAVAKSLEAARKKLPEALEKAAAAKKEAKPEGEGSMDEAGMDGAAMDGGAMGEKPEPPMDDGMGDGMGEGK
jgi:S1-C subfamily serine protease